MPYSRISELPARVKDNVPSTDGKRLFMNVVNNQLEAGQPESVAFASAWAALSNAGYDENDEGQWVMVEKVDLKIGDRVSWNSSGGTARGVIREIITDGDVPGIDGDVKVIGSMDEPAAQIEIIDDDGEPTGTIVGHKISTLSKASPTSSAVHVPSTECKAQYDGREVELDKPFRLPQGSSSKFGVYVRDGDDVKRVTFGSPDMEIRRDDDEARANFRARFSCDTATDKTSARYWSCRMWEADTTVSELTSKEAAAEFVIEKRQVGEQAYTFPDEARAEAINLGFKDGAIHVHDINGMAVYMPGPDHESYLNRMAELAGIDEDDDEEDDNMLERTVRAIMASVIGKKSKGLNAGPNILKFQEDEQIVWGWASVVTENGEEIFDTQGDAISPQEMEKAATEFMLDARMAKAMHDGEQIGEVVHSLPLTKELGQALGVQSDREGWIIAMKIHDPDVWQKVKSGEYRAFSIGGAAVNVPVTEAA